MTYSKIRDWLLDEGITSVGMESTGVYWVGLYQVLDDAGLEVCLVNAKDLKSVKGRPKTDKLDCQWGQRLHSYGLLRPSFRPDKEICAIRAIWRMREQSVRDAGRCIQRMQKALHEMNLLLPKVVSEITGKTGMAMIKAILAGERVESSMTFEYDLRVRTRTVSPEPCLPRRNGCPGPAPDQQQSESRNMRLAAAPLHPKFSFPGVEAAP